MGRTFFDGTWREAPEKGCIFGIQQNVRKELIDPQKERLLQDEFYYISQKNVVARNAFQI